MRWWCLLLLVSPVCAYASLDDKVAGAAPGMSAAQVKTAGFVECARYGDKEVQCVRPGFKELVYGLEVTSVFAVLQEPYAVVDRVGVVFVSDRPCKKGSGQWKDVKGAECFVDIPKGISAAVGEYRSARKGNYSWHDCGAIELRFDGRTKRAEITNKPSEARYRKSICESSAQLKSRRDEKDKVANDFIGIMK